ncbi:hypothetical protein RIF29_07301 [Crotalaria pallida]|uniref:DUF4408 domain-containing protein n=1 Tax=Crotalaria pallida TaxID=3830 RepID=A0AAN9J5M7_CROPI
MYEEAAATIGRWLTPSSLFIFTNLVIATILITSRYFAAPNNNTHHLLRSPSLLHRLSSFNYYSSYNYNNLTPTESSTQADQLVRTPSLLQRVKSFNFCLYDHHQQTEHAQLESQNPNPVNNNNNNNNNNQEQEPKLVRAPSLLQRLQSINLLRGEKEPEAGSEDESEETVEGRRPMTAPERRWLMEEEEAGGVDAKADDFIKRFKKQLRLQRVDSILRYRRQMIKSSN